MSRPLQSRSQVPEDVLVQLVPPGTGRVLDLFPEGERTTTGREVG